MTQETKPAEAPSTKLTKKTDAPATLGQLVVAMKSTIAQCIPQHLHPERMARVALAALRTTPHLAECTQASFGASLMGASLLGLEPNTPLQQAWLVPYKNNRRNVYEAQLLLGYQGMIELCNRSGRTHPIRATPVFEGDVFEYELGLTPRLEHKPSKTVDRDDYSKLTHVYAICRLKDPQADPIFVVLTKAQVERRRARGANGPAWKTDPIAMALKTGVRALFPWIPKSPEMALADALETRIETGRSQGGVVVTALSEEAVATFESTGITLTDGSDEEELDPDAPSPAPSAPEQDGRRIKLKNLRPAETAESAPPEPAAQKPPHDPQTGEVLDQAPADPEKDGR